MSMLSALQIYARQMRKRVCNVPEELSLVEVRPGLSPGRSSTIAACPPVLAAISKTQHLKE